MQATNVHRSWGADTNSTAAPALIASKDCLTCESSAPLQADGWRETYSVVVTTYRVTKFEVQALGSADCEPRLARAPLELFISIDHDHPSGDFPAGFLRMLSEEIAQTGVIVDGDLLRFSREIIEARGVGTDELSAFMTAVSEAVGGMGAVMGQLEADNKAVQERVAREIEAMNERLARA